MNILINASRRMLMVNNSVCGCLITGSDKVRSGFGNGDCIYLDFKNLVFAVADGTERYPWASRDLLQRLKENLEHGVPGSVDHWRDMVNSMYNEQRYHFKTTFSCVSLKHEGDGVILFVIHGGDSAVTVMNSRSGSVIFKTSADMNFAGRSRSIDDVTEHRIYDRHLRVIIATDGLKDFLKLLKEESPSSGFHDLFVGRGTGTVCEGIHEIIEERHDSFEYDDIGCIIIDPFCVTVKDPWSILLGGTRPGAEQVYVKKRGSDIEDRWINISRCEEKSEDLKLAGFDIFSGVRGATV